MNIKNHSYIYDAMVEHYLINDKMIQIKKDLYQIFVLGSYYALKYINDYRYENLIPQFHYDEVVSYVYLAFEYALKHFWWEKTKYDINKFKNYFFQIIRYHTINEVQITTNWKVVNQYKNLTKISNFFIDEINASDCEQEIIQKKVETIKVFLKTKNVFYLHVFEEKIKGLSNIEIAQKYNVNVNSVKSAYQYLKKLIIKKYKSVDEIEISSINTD